MANDSDSFAAGMLFMAARMGLLPTVEHEQDRIWRLQRENDLRLAEERRCNGGYTAGEHIGMVAGEPVKRGNPIQSNSTEQWL